MFLNSSLRPSARVSVALVTAVIMVFAMAGCTDNKAVTGDERTVKVTASDTACTLSKVSVPSGTVTFTVTNEGSRVNEFYLLASDGLRILGEIENIGPGLSRDLVIAAQPGSYLSACKPGMVGDGIRAAFTVTDSGTAVTPSGDEKAQLETATKQYALYVRDQTEQLLAGTQEFVSAFTAGDTATAKKLYPTVRMHWERIEPVAESFGDLDPKMDAREADVAAGDAWTGWHVAEKDLWPPDSGYTALTAAQRKAISDQLLADTKTLYQRTRTVSFTVDQIANGAKSLLDEVASGKVTGEEEIWSHTDLWDFQANVEGARVAWENLRPILKQKDPALDKQLETQFAAMRKLLDQHRSGDGFVLYDQLTKAQVKALADQVNALAEPLSKLTAAVLR